jgi:hypothetical protein
MLHSQFQGTKEYTTKQNPGKQYVPHSSEDLHILCSVSKLLWFLGNFRPKGIVFIV